MGRTPQELLSRLQELGISFERHNHPVVMTVEEQAKYIGNLEGGHSKNLFLKDKKNRLYIISALTTTNVEYKSLAQRLGLGKGGLRFAPEEALKEVLQVPLGCVTPFALFNDSARSVSLLLDHGFKRHKICFFHPLSNDITIALASNDLDKFLRSIRHEEPVYVDFEAIVPVGKDQPPDLAAYVPCEVSITCGAPSATETNNVNRKPEVQQSVRVKDDVNSDKRLNKHKEKNIKNEKSKNKDSQIPSASCVSELVKQIIDKVGSTVLTEITTETISPDGMDMGAKVAAGLQKQLSLDLESLLTGLKNAAYTEGYSAGRASAMSSQSVRRKTLEQMKTKAKILTLEIKKKSREVPPNLTQNQRRTLLSSIYLTRDPTIESVQATAYKPHQKIPHTKFYEVKKFEGK